MYTHTTFHLFMLDRVCSSNIRPGAASSSLNDAVNHSVFIETYVCNIEFYRTLTPYHTRTVFELNANCWKFSNDWTKSKPCIECDIQGKIGYHFSSSKSSYFDLITIIVGHLLNKAPSTVLKWQTETMLTQRDFQGPPKGASTHKG